jgi:hypothetical protein
MVLLSVSWRVFPLAGENDATGDS